MIKPLQAIYRGNRMFELNEEIDLPSGANVVLFVVEEGDDEEFDLQLRLAAERLFAEDWDSEEDEVWNEYAKTT